MKVGVHTVNIAIYRVFDNNTTGMARGEGLMFEFSNPSFSGQGFSTHALSIAQLEFNRQKDVDDDIASAEAKRLREEANSILNKFLNNVESRIYAQLSKQLVDNMFGICDPGCD